MQALGRRMVIKFNKPGALTARQQAESGLSGVCDDPGDYGQVESEVEKMRQRVLDFS
ncbi:MAG: hypothetical protein V1792_19840 [Pseudomonadota bacterium]